MRNQTAYLLQQMGITLWKKRTDAVAPQLTPSVEKQHQIPSADMAEPVCVDKPALKPEAPTICNNTIWLVCDDKALQKSHREQQLVVNILKAMTLTKQDLKLFSMQAFIDQKNAVLPEWLWLAGVTDVSVEKLEPQFDAVKILISGSLQALIHSKAEKSQLWQQICRYRK